MSVDATRWAWNRRGLKPTQKLLLLALIHNANENNICGLTVSQIEEITNLTPKAITTGFRVLGRLGLITRRSEFNKWETQVNLTSYQTFEDRYPHLNESEVYGRLEGPKWTTIRYLILERDNYTCTYCGAVGVELFCDHIHPIAKGGTNYADNLTTACHACNCKKGDKLLHEWITTAKQHKDFI